MYRRAARTCSWIGPRRVFSISSAAAGALGKDHHVDLRAGKEFLRRVVEEQEADVAGLDEFVAALDDVHQPAEFYQRHLGRLTVQAAADFLQVRLDQRQPQVFHAGRLAQAVVERDRGRQAEQFPLVLALGLDRAGVAADVVVLHAVPGRHFLGSHVRPVLAAGSPQHDQVLAVHLLDAPNAHSVRTMASGFHPALYSMRSRSTVRCRTRSSTLIGSLLVNRVGWFGKIVETCHYRGSTGSGVVFGQGVNHVESRCSKTTPDPFPRPTVTGTPLPGNRVHQRNQRPILPDHAAARWVRDKSIRRTSWRNRRHSLP